MEKQHVKRHNMSREYYDKRARLCMLLYEKPLIQFLEGNDKIRDVDAPNLNLSFTWKDTREGWDFWAGLHSMMDVEGFFILNDNRDPRLI